MRRLAEFEQPRVAQAFVDYLNLQKLHSQLFKEESGYVIYLKDAKDELAALKELQAFQQNPLDPKYVNASWHTGVHFKGAGDFQLAGYINKIKQQSGWLTQLLILLSVVSFFAMKLLASPDYFANLQFLSINQVLQNQRWWQLMTPVFVHFTAVHLIFNLLWLWYLGGRIEVGLSSKSLLLIVTLSALFSNYAQYLTDGPNFGGMSGVVYGLLGFCWIYGWKTKDELLSIPKGIVGFMLIWLIIGYTDSLWVNVANTAHSAGLLTGIILGFVFAGKESSRNSVNN